MCKPEFTPLTGVRFLGASSPEASVKWQEGMIKEYTFGEPIEVRPLSSESAAVTGVRNIRVSVSETPVTWADGSIKEMSLVSDLVVPAPLSLPARQAPEGVGQAMRRDLPEAQTETSGLPEEHDPVSAPANPDDAGEA